MKTLYDVGDDVLIKATVKRIKVIESGTFYTVDVKEVNNYINYICVHEDEISNPIDEFVKFVLKDLSDAASTELDSVRNYILVKMEDFKNDKNN